ncbi:alpha/beta fold hydrolase [Pseudooceanicola sp. 502str34]
MLRFLSLALLCLGPVACSSLPPPQQAESSPIIHEPNLNDEVDKLIVLVPGAMATVDIFSPVLGWDDSDSSILAFRFPGLDGLPLDHRVDILQSGAYIAEAVNRIRPKHLYLIGFSTGGPVALEAARRVETADVHVALVSSASSFPDTLVAAAEGAVDVASAFIRSGGTSMDAAWLENYRTLLYGRKHYDQPGLAEKSEALAEEQRGHITTPSVKMTLAHTGSLMGWVYHPDPKLERANIALFHGGDDNLFPLRRARRFAGEIPADAFYTYPEQGHLLFVTAPTLFDDIHRFFGLEDD